MMTMIIQLILLVLFDIALSVAMEIPYELVDDSLAMHRVAHEFESAIVSSVVLTESVDYCTQVPRRILV